MRLPYAASHEKLWREDGVYDIVVILGHNDDPPVAGAGSVWSGKYISDRCITVQPATRTA